MKMNLPYLLGSMMLAQRAVAHAVGAMMHAAMSVAFALAHVAIYQALETDTSLAAWGVLLGFAHYLIAGMGLGMMPMAHPLFGVLVGVFYDVLGGV